MRHLILFALAFLISFSATAGVMELGASYSTRNSSIDKDNYTENTSWTGSFAWYFLEMSAIEFSYTKGQATQSLKAVADPNATLYYADFEMFGADLVITFAGKTSVLQPFVRGGFARLKKEFYKEDTSNGQITAYGEPVDQVVPSYGAGLKINITQSFNIKGSYDRWRSGTNNDKDIWDDAIKGGISWYF
ncbi:MAG: outer membrane beta-barrel protein [Bdellovibrionales bacterium]|nr:outer membrane beta-barrel protein [Bdellovibrionales bacterium]